MKKILQEAAREQGITLSQLIRDALNEHIETYNLHKKRKGSGWNESRERNQAG